MAIKIINKWTIIAGIVVIVAAGWVLTRSQKAEGGAQQKIIHLRRGDIQTVISTTGTVLPRNRLEVKPPVAGRVDQVLVREGQQVKAGETLILMSSSDRAALLDAARGKGEAELKYWQDVYKPMPLVAPIDGEVIVGTVQPGQTLAVSDDAIVLSDRLIVRAQVDETDIGKIEETRPAQIGIDAYPGEKINAVVDHIYRESTTVNNVTVYSVDLAPEKVPSFFRSGMNATVDFIQESHKGVMTLPVAAVQKEKDGTSFVLVRTDDNKKIERRPVEPGLSDDKRVEIISGLDENDDVILAVKKYARAVSSGTNPFAPARPSRGGAGPR